MSMKEIRQRRHELVRELEYLWKNPKLTSDDHLWYTNELENLIEQVKIRATKESKKES